MGPSLSIDLHGRKMPIIDGNRLVFFDEYGHENISVNFTGQAYDNSVPDYSEKQSEKTVSRVRGEKPKHQHVVQASSIYGNSKESSVDGDPTPQQKRVSVSRCSNTKLDISRRIRLRSGRTIECEDDADSISSESSSNTDNLEVFDSPGVQKGNERNEVHLSQVLVTETVMNVATESGSSFEHPTAEIEGSVGETRDSETVNLEGRPRKSPKPRVKMEPGIDAQVSIADNLTMVSGIDVSTLPYSEIGTQVIPNSTCLESKRTKYQVDENQNVIDQTGPHAEFSREEKVLNSKLSPGALVQTGKKKPRKTAKFIPCGMCNFQATSIQMLKFHKYRQHTGSRVFSCKNEWCDYATKRRGNLEVHQMKCNAEKKCAQRTDSANILATS